MKYTNKSLINNINKLLSENEKTWDLRLKYALCTNRISTKKSIGTSAFQLLYGTDVIFLVQLGLLVVVFLQDETKEPNEVQKRF